MSRGVCLFTVMLLGLVLVGGTYEARQARPSIHAQQVADNLYMLGSDPEAQGMRTGGNTALFVTADGVVLVDTKLQGYGPDILAEVRQVTNKPVTTIINTHTHFDHSGSNAEFGNDIHSVAHENLRSAMARASCQPVTNCDAFKGENRKYLPTTTFSERMTLFSGPDQIDLYYFGRGHTDGDTFVVFREARTMHTGDMFPGKSLPFIDAENGNGGSATEFGRTLTKAIAGVSGVDTLISGHWDTPLPWSALVEYASFYNDLVSQARQSWSAGGTVEESADSYSVPEQYAEFSAVPQAVTRIVQLLSEGR